MIDFEQSSVATNRECDRRGLLVGAFACFSALVLPGCSEEAEPAQSTAKVTKAKVVEKKDTVEQLRAKLETTAQVISEIGDKNNKLTEKENHELIVRLFNAFNADLQDNFSEAGLEQYSAISNIDMSATSKAALRHDLLLELRPYKNEKLGKFGTHVALKVVRDTALEIPAHDTDKIKMHIDTTLNGLRVYALKTVLESTSAPQSAGRMFIFRGTPSVLIDEEFMRINADNAGIDYEKLRDEVILNEVGHFVVGRHLGIHGNEELLRKQLVDVVVGNRREKCSVLQFEEAFSDYYSLTLGDGSLPHLMLSFRYRQIVPGYKITNELFLRGVNLAMQVHQKELEPIKVDGKIDLKTLDSHMHHTPQIKVLEPSFRRIIANEYYRFIRRNLFQVKAKIIGDTK